MFRRPQVCPVTKYTRHQFDATTHRCPCGQWARGYKPQVEPVRPRAECQICERTQAIDPNGGMTNHGYQRPGCGFIVGNCAGCGFPPFPATNALTSYRATLVRIIAGKKARLAELPTLAEVEYHYTAREGGQKVAKVRTLKAGDVYGYDAAQRQTFPGFADYVASLVRKTEADLKAAREELARVERRITKGEALAAHAS
jgi:hypothetical protein